MIDHKTATALAWGMWIIGFGTGAVAGVVFAMLFAVAKG